MALETSTSAPEARPGARGRPRLVAASPAPVAEPRDGGRRRLREVARALAAWTDVEVVSLAPADSHARRIEIGPGLVEQCVPKGARFEAAQGRLERLLGGVPAGDLAMAFEIGSAPEYLDALADAVRGADLLLASHVYAVPALDAVGSAPLWLDAPDHECSLKRSLLPPGLLAAELLHRLAVLEREAWHAAAWVTLARVPDQRALEATCGRRAAGSAQLANGVDTEAIDFTPPLERVRRRGVRPGAAASPFVLLFVGTHHGPNVDAVDWLLDHAAGFSGCELRLLGAAGGAFAADARTNHPGIHLLGEVSEAERLAALAAADLGLAPMRSGTGTQLKVLEYAAAGLPVLSTPLGLRGLGFAPGAEVAVAELDQWREEIQSLRAAPDRREAMARAARARVEREHDWRRAVADAWTASPFVRFGAPR